MVVFNIALVPGGIQMREVPLRIHLIISASIMQPNCRAPQSDSSVCSLVWCSRHPTRKAKSSELSSKAVAPARLAILGFILATAPGWGRSLGRQGVRGGGVGEGEGRKG